MTKEEAVRLMNDERAMKKYCDDHVHFKGKFFEPRGGYYPGEHDKINTRYCVLKIASQ